MTIEFDLRKNRTNIRKHKISIPELATIFDNPFITPTMDVPDVVHSQYEKRYHAFGWTTNGWYVIIWYTIQTLVPRTLTVKRNKLLPIFKKVVKR